MCEFYFENVKTLEKQSWEMSHMTEIKHPRTSLNVLPCHPPNRSICSPTHRQEFGFLQAKYNILKVEHSCLETESFIGVKAAEVKAG